MTHWLDVLRDLRQRGIASVAVTVIATRGSAPRADDAKESDPIRTNSTVAGRNSDSLIGISFCEAWISIVAIIESLEL